MEFQMIVKGGETVECLDKRGGIEGRTASHTWPVITRIPPEECSFEDRVDEGRIQMPVSPPRMVGSGGGFAIRLCRRRPIPGTQRCDDPVCMGQLDVAFVYIPEFSGLIVKPDFGVEHDPVLKVNLGLCIGKGRVGKVESMDLENNGQVVDDMIVLIYHDFPAISARGRITWNEYVEPDRLVAMPVRVDIDS